MADRVVSDQQLDEWERLANEATPGPWERVKRDAEFMFKDEVIAPCGCCGHIAAGIAGWDAEFIAAAREAVPALIAEVRASHAREAALRKDLAETRRNRDTWKRRCREAAARNQNLQQRHDIEEAKK